MVSKQIGWSQEANLLYSICNQIDLLTKVTAASGGGSGSVVSGNGITVSGGAANLGGTLTSDVQIYGPSNSLYNFYIGDPFDPNFGVNDFQVNSNGNISLIGYNAASDIIISSGQNTTISTGNIFEVNSGGNISLEFLSTFTLKTNPNLPKQVILDLNTISNSTTRTFSFPNENGTFELTSNFLGLPLAAPNTTEDGQAVRWNDGTGSWEYFTPASIESVLETAIAFKSVGWWSAQGNSTSVNSMGLVIPTATGTATQVDVATTNIYTVQRGIEYLVTTPASNAVAAFRLAANQFWLGNIAGLGGFDWTLVWGPATGCASTTRAFAGFTTNTGAATDVQPSSLLNMFGMGWDAADTNIQFMRNDGSGTASKTNLGASFPKPTTDRTIAYKIRIYAAPNSTTINYTVTSMDSGDTAVGTFNTDLPAANTLLSPRCYMSVGGVSSVVGVKLIRMVIATDY